MKITKFDPNYPWKLGDTTLAQGGGVSVVTGDSGSTGGSSGTAGGDLSGAFPDPTVVGIQGTPVDALPAIATEYLDGTGHWTTPTGSGTGYVTNIGGGKEVINTIAASGASHTLDLSLGNVQDLTLTASCTLTFSGATAGVFCSFELFLRQDGSGGWVTTWPGSVIWPGGTPPTLSTTPSTVTVLAFGSEDGGTTWYGFPTHGGGGAGSDVVNVATGAGSVTIPGLKGSSDAIPPSPSAYDDEFDALSGWTTLGTLDTSNVTDTPSHWHGVRNTGATTALNGIYKTAPSAPFTVSARFFAGPGPTGAAIWGLMLGDSTPTAWYTWGPCSSGWGAWNDILSSPWTNITTRGSTVDNNMTGLIYPYPKWLRMVVHASNNIDLAISEDGYYWRTIRTGQDSGLTVAKVGIAVGSAGGSGTPDILVDYIRFA